MAWTDEQKAKAKELYLAAKPTPETSTEIIKDIAVQLEQTPNGVRMILIQDGVYVKKAEPAAGAKADGKKASGEAKGTRVSKESQIQLLKDLINNKGGTVDDDILDKLTGKAAAYLVEQLGK